MDETGDGNTEEAPGAGSPAASEDQDTALQKVSCPGCSEIYEIQIPSTGEERSITICPFCEQKFFVRHEAVGEKSPEPSPAPTLPSSSPLPAPPPSPPSSQLPGPAAVGPGIPAVFAPKTKKSTQPKKRTPKARKPVQKREDGPPQAFADNPSVAGMKAASICFLKRLPVVIIPVFGLLYLFTLGIYDATRAGAYRFLELSPGPRDGAIKLGMLFGLIFATVVTLLVYFIFSLLTVSVFFAFSEIMIVVTIFSTSLFFSALGSRAALG
jgi:hypothetical protein